MLRVSYRPLWMLPPTGRATRALNFSAYAWYLATPQHALLGWIRHRENIRRLLRGEESKIGKKKKGA